MGRHVASLIRSILSDSGPLLRRFGGPAGHYRGELAGSNGTLSVQLQQRQGQLSCLGGVVQGVGQALFEAIRIDSPSGQLLKGSFLDYTKQRDAARPHLYAPACMRTDNARRC